MEIKMKTKPFLILVLSGMILAVIVIYNLWINSNKENTVDLKYLFLRSENSKIVELCHGENKIHSMKL
jgi:hypothetical protein